MDVAAMFAGVATGISQAFGGPFHPALLHRPAAHAEDAGGSLIAGTAAAPLPCSVQVDAVTEGMRQAEGFAEKDQRILVLAATLDGGISTADQIEVTEGPHAGRWMIASVGRDPAGCYFECRGRRA